MDPGNAWGSISPEHLLALRACSPYGVFNARVLEGFLAAVRGNETLTALAPALFGSDLSLFKKLPDEFAYAKPQLLALMRTAYEKDIRLADPRVLKMKL